LESKIEDEPGRQELLMLEEIKDVIQLRVGGRPRGDGQMERPVLIVDDRDDLEQRELALGKSKNVFPWRDRTQGGGRGLAAGQPAEDLSGPGFPLAEDGGRLHRCHVERDLLARRQGVGTEGQHTPGITQMGPLKNAIPTMLPLEL
jgi:hypothetical protein